VLDKERVRVLASSKEMEQKYGHPAIVVAFEVGKGKVYHMTSHFYLPAHRDADEASPGGRHELRHVEGRLHEGPGRRVHGVAQAGAPHRGASRRTPRQRAVANMVVEQGKRVETRKKII